METSNSPVNVNSFLLDIVFRLEDGGNMYIRNFRLSADRTASQPTRLYTYSSLYLFFSTTLATGNITELRTYVRVNAVDMSWLYLRYQGIMPTLSVNTTVIFVLVIQSKCVQKLDSVCTCSRPIRERTSKSLRI
jgi:hypothetical protein